MAKAPRKPSQPLLRDTDGLQSRRIRQRDARQPDLPFDPMPERVEPRLALLKLKPPSGPQWAFEVKWDGYRLMVHTSHDNGRVITRGGHDWTDRFPSIVDAARRIGTSFILDGEAVVLDAAGRSDFGALQQALGGRGGKRSAGEAVLFAFDLLYLDGHDLRKMPFGDRRHLLDDLDLAPDGAIRLSQEIEADSAELLASACSHGLEGIIAKDRNAPYRSGRGGDWLKIKCIQSESFVIAGYEPSKSARGGLGSLLLAASRNGELVYVGSVGTGFKEGPTRQLKSALDKIKVNQPKIVFDDRTRGIVWVEPRLVAEIDFRAWTKDGHLRHASYKGLRDGADHAEVYRLDQ